MFNPQNKHSLARLLDIQTTNPQDEKQIQTIRLIDRQTERWTETDSVRKELYSSPCVNYRNAEMLFIIMVSAVNYFFIPEQDYSSYFNLSRTQNKTHLSRLKDFHIEIK